MSSLEDELEIARQTVRTDGYPMSIGELTNLYRDGELKITPQFQRLFRWDDAQKSKLIESILIGIPLPSIFVAQDSEGNWELVDGLQRVSTLLQLQGLLNRQEFPPLRLIKTKYLPSLEGKTWEGGPEESLTPAQRKDIKRSKIDVKIVERGSDPKTKFDLFQRLNSFGSPLSNQEIRNAQLVGISPEFVSWINKLSTLPDFIQLLRLPDRELKRKYDEELVLRFLFLHQLNAEGVRSISNFQEQLEAFSVDLASSFDPTSHRTEKYDQVFRTTFHLLSEASDDVLRKWDTAKNYFTGGFSNTSFEAIATSLGYLLSTESPYRKNLEEVSKEFWSNDNIQNHFVTGKSTESRMKAVIPLGREVFQRNIE